jgi:hypothetical protein
LRFADLVQACLRQIADAARRALRQAVHTMNMHIEPILPDFQFLRLTRSGGILGVTQTLHVTPDMQAAMTDSHATWGTRTVQLDAYTAQELMAAMSTLAVTRPGPSTRRGADMFSYDIELGWGGHVYRVHSVDIGADEALHGVMMAASRVLAGESADPLAGDGMTLHTVAPA